MLGMVNNDFVQKTDHYFGHTDLSILTPRINENEGHLKSLSDLLKHLGAKKSMEIRIMNYDKPDVKKKKLKIHLCNYIKECA